MDFRNEYRIVPWIGNNNMFRAEVRRWWWPFWAMFDWEGTKEAAERECRKHAGEETKYLGRLP